MIKAVQDLFVVRVPCAAHTLALVMTSLDRVDVDDVVAGDMRNMVENYKAVMTAAKKLTDHFHRSTKDWDALRGIAESTRFPVAKYVLWTDTRWNSAYRCLERAMKNQDALRSCAFGRGGLGAAVKECSDVLYRQRDFISAVMDIMREFEAWSTRLCVEHRVTLSLYPVAVLQLQDLCNRENPSNPDEHRQLYRQFIADELAKRFDSDFAPPSAMSARYDKHVTYAESPGQRREEKFQSTAKRLGRLPDVVIATMMLDPRTCKCADFDLKIVLRYRAAEYLQELKANLDARDGNIVQNAGGGNSPRRDSEPESGSDDAAPGLDDADTWRKLLRKVAKFVGNAHDAACEQRPGLTYMTMYNNVLKFWQKHGLSKWTELYRLATAVLAVPATEAASERVFKKAKAVITPERANLDPLHAEEQVVVGRAVAAMGVDSLKEFAAMKFLSRHCGANTMAT